MSDNFEFFAQNWIQKDSFLSFFFKFSLFEIAFYLWVNTKRFMQCIIEPFSMFYIPEVPLEGWRRLEADWLISATWLNRSNGAHLSETPRDEWLVWRNVSIKSTIFLRISKMKNFKKSFSSIHNDSFQSIIKRNF